MGKSVIIMGCHPGTSETFCRHDLVEKMLEKTTPEISNNILVGNKNCLLDFSGIIGLERIELKSASIFFPLKSYQAQSHELLTLLKSIENVTELHFTGYSPISFFTANAITFKTLNQNIRLEYHNAAPNLEVLKSLDSSFLDKAIFQFMWTEIQNFQKQTSDNKEHLLDEKISIIIPHYNQGEFLTETINSLSHILNHKEFEVIVIDDGSNDANSKRLFSSLKIKFQDTDSNIKFFETKNQGVGAARNLGAKLSTADYLLFLDSDNLVIDSLDLHLKNCLEFCKSNEIVTFPNLYFRKQIGDFKTRDGVKGFFPLGNVPEISWIENFLGDAMFLIKKSIFLNLGGFNEETNTTHQDWQFLLKASMREARIRVYPFPIYHYRVWPGSMSYYMDDSSGRLRAAEIFVDNFFKQTNPDLLAMVFFNLSADLRKNSLQYIGASSESLMARKLLASIFPLGSIRRKAVSRTIRLFARLIK
jgi:glycosyltransferase involved in cell wall biosynthesis